MNIEIIHADSEDASEILALQKIAYQKEARLYDNWNISDALRASLMPS